MAESLVKGQWVPMAFGKPGFGLNKKRAKYGNRKCVWQGEKFDSKRELERHLVLLDMQKRGEISTLIRQRRYPMIVKGVEVCTYIPDWTYIERGKPDVLVCEDAKGVKTAAFVIKFKLAKALYPEIDWRLS
jgi:hypothetical protein